MTDDQGRPGSVVLVAGTGTEVGKTWVAAQLLTRWRAAGLVVAARKPAQSGDPGAGRSDADVLGGASGEDPLAVCPASHRYEVALAPPMAAEALGRPRLTLAGLLGALPWSRWTDVGLVETAGGVRSPQADDADGVALARALHPDTVVLVAPAGLGTINAVRLSVDALDPVTGPWGRSAPVTVVLNRFDESDDTHVRNRAWLRERDGLDVVESPGALDDLAGRWTAPQPQGLQAEGVSDGR